MGQIGRPLRRKEDARFLTGTGRYVADAAAELGAAHMRILRSPHGAALIRGIDTSTARALPGVLDVITGADLEKMGIGGLPCAWPVTSRDGTPMIHPPHPVLAVDRVLHVGDPLAAVVAETEAQADAAVEAIEVEYEPLPCQTDLATALAPGAARVRAELPHNRCFDWDLGDEAAVDSALAASPRVVTLDLIQNRVNASPMETRGTLGVYDRGHGDYTLWTSSQNPHSIRVTLSAATLKVPEEKLRVISPDVGGGFGMKIYHYSEEVLVLVAAKRTGRPVRWIASRLEAFQADTYARDHVTTVSLGLDEDGRFRAMKVHTLANMGAYLSTFAPSIPTFFYANPFPGPYALRDVYVHVEGVFTNTTPVDAYRGAGRPEANYLIERLIDTAARATGRSPAELRRINYIPATAMPYTNAMGTTYDCGDFALMQSRALEAADMAGFAERRRQSAAKGRLRGIGMASYIEWTQGNPKEEVRIRFEADGSATVLVGTQSNGQGHETSFAQVAAELLGMPFEKVQVVMGDTARVKTGGGTGGSRSLQMAGSAIRLASEAVVERARSIAAEKLEAAAEDLVFEDGRFTVAGTDLGMDMEAVAQIALDAGAPLDESRTFDRPAPTFPNGCHVAEVEIDPETGRVEPVRYVVADDFGKVVNPMIVMGQVQGGVAQGLGQALMEHAVYDDDSGQLLTGSFMDYGMPRAEDMIFLDIRLYEDLPTASSGLGSKGCGEAGTIGACPAIMNAINDALIAEGAGEIDMPATPARVWAALGAARSTAAA
ncbi:MAG TPA: carbon monoxide dehydrogenase [Tistrella mobilis]|uniref:Carbon monoxide dehydrogenase n=1 Tax=Tistrella mobilis TaxID=171437 RepID=A0A3B9IHR0_9PROT|nr:carbon monoxide dehydrogenase [Tistrella mobilis]